LLLRIWFGFSHPTHPAPVTPDRPGAVHLDFLDLLREDNTFKSLEEMRRLCEARGLFFS